MKGGQGCKVPCRADFGQGFLTQKTALPSTTAPAPFHHRHLPSQDATKKSGPYSCNLDCATQASRHGGRRLVPFLVVMDTAALKLLPGRLLERFRSQDSSCPAVSSAHQGFNQTPHEHTKTTTTKK